MVEPRWQSALPLLGNFPKVLGIWESTWDLDFREFSKQAWEFWYIQEISWNTCNSKLITTNFGCVHALSHCLSLCHVSAITAFTYLLRSFLKRCSSHSSAVKTCKACCYVIFHFFITLGILRSTWEFLEHNLGNSRKVEWQHWWQVSLGACGI